VPEAALNAGAHYLILDEGEITVPHFLEAIAKGELKASFAPLRNRMSPKAPSLASICSSGIAT
jgi:radical SAM superfamily enzyme YgiQ (UPF0313 family)